MTTELATYEVKPLTAGELRAQVNLIQEVMKAVMVKDTHYGVIPGTPKPTLYKPGAEKILVTFGIVVDNPMIEDLSMPPEEIRYRVTQRGLRRSDGVLLGAGVGECSSDEEKYKWRKPVCMAEFDETPEDRKRIVWKKGSEGLYQAKQIRMNPKDVANTILKMAVKRALVAMTLVVTAASDIFDQDIEDLPEGLETEQAAKPPIQQPKAKKETSKDAPPDPTEPPGPYANEKQAKRFWAIAKASGRNDDDIHVWLKDRYGINSTTKIPTAIYDKACTNIATPPEPGSQG